MDAQPMISAVALSVKATWATWVSFAGIAMAVGIAAEAFTRRRAMLRFGSVSDEDFALEEPLRRLPRRAVLKERQWLAAKLGLSPFSLSAEIEFGDLEDLEFFLGSTISVRLGDLEFELVERFPHEREIPRLGREFSVGELVAWLASRSK